jgi:cystathionine gamma-lyase
MNRYTKKEDICTHLGDDYGKFSGAIVPPIFQNSLFVVPNEGNGIGEHGYRYTRVTNPTTEVAEKKIAALEEGDAARCFASGMAAITSGIMYFVKKDCHVICVQTVYGPTRKFLEEYLHEKIGVEVTFVLGNEVSEIEAAIKENTTLIYLESPSSAVFNVQDLEAVAKLAKSKGIGTVIDNSYATPLYQNPLKYGIDIVVHTVSKYLGGHSDIIGGVLVANQEIADSIAKNERELYGGIMDPHQSWLLLRGIRTLPVRVKQHTENAMKVATFLENHPKVERVFYPGLASHPQKALIDKQMVASTGLMSFVPKGTAEDARKVIANLKLFPNGCSWGGFESLAIGISVGQTAEEAAKVGLPANLIRIHVGLENVESLIADLDQALATID